MNINKHIMFLIVSLSLSLFVQQTQMDCWNHAQCALRAAPLCENIRVFPRFLTEEAPWKPNDPSHHIHLRGANTPQFLHVSWPRDAKGANGTSV